MTKVGEEPLLVSPAWIVEVYVEGRLEKFCLDSYMINAVSEAYRRAIFVFPEKVCQPVPPPNITPLKSSLDAEATLALVLEGCREAVNLLSRAGHQRKRRFSILRYMLMMPPTTEEQKLAEADQAYKLCSILFGTDLSASIARSRRAYLIYTIGGEDTASKRLRGLMRIDTGFAEKIAKLFKEASEAQNPHQPSPSP